MTHRDVACTGAVGLADHAPFMDQLARRDLLKGHLDCSPDGDLVGWSPWEIGIKIDTRVLVQGNQRQIVRLIGHAPVEPAVLDHDLRSNMAPPADLFPLQLVTGAADLAGLLRWILEPVTGGTVLQDQPLLIHSVPEGFA